MNNSVKKIENFFEYYRFIEKIKKEYPEANWDDCLSKGQVKSKLWLIDELINISNHLGTIFIYGGWYGILAKFMFESELKFDVIRSFDLDDSCYEIAETINRSFVMSGWRFKATTYDIFDIQYPLKYDTLRRDGTSVELNEMPSTIINTSCEHMINDWLEDIDNDTLMILQSNDLIEINDHINCVKDIEDMKNKYSLNKILYEGELRLDGYTRYMLIGYK